MSSATKNNLLTLNHSQFRPGALVAPPPPAKFFPLNLANVSTDGDSSKTFSKPQTVCYFFDLQQTGASKFHCIKGAACDYLHEVSL